MLTILPETAATPSKLVSTPGLKAAEDAGVFPALLQATRSELGDGFSPFDAPVSGFVSAPFSADPVSKIAEQGSLVGMQKMQKQLGAESLPPEAEVALTPEDLELPEGGKSMPIVGNQLPPAAANPESPAEPGPIDPLSKGHAANAVSLPVSSRGEGSPQTAALATPPRSKADTKLPGAIEAEEAVSETPLQKPLPSDHSTKVREGNEAEASSKPAQSDLALVQTAVRSDGVFGAVAKPIPPQDAPRTPLNPQPVPLPAAIGAMAERAMATKAPAAKPIGQARLPADERIEALGRTERDRSIAPLPNDLVRGKADTKAASKSAMGPGEAPLSQQPGTPLSTQPNSASAAAQASSIAQLAPGNPVNEARADTRPVTAPVTGIASAIDQLAEARESGRSVRPELTLRHAEFGAVNMRIEATGSDLRATIASRDPAFIPAVQAALAERGVAAAGESMAAQTSAGNSGNSGRGGDQSGAQHSGSHNNSSTGAGLADGRYGSSTGSGQGSPQPYREQSGANDEQSVADGRTGSTDTDISEARDTGLFA